MSDSLGGTVIIVLIVLFITIVSGYLAFNVNYTKAFKMKNKIVDTYEKYKGNCDGNSDCNDEIDGYSDFVFINRFGNILLPHDINRAIKRICKGANEWEQEKAKKEGRTPVVIRSFSVHNLRHTFCTRLCEVENNIKIIIEIMGHADVKTTMSIYNELQEAKKKEAFEELNKKIKIS